MRFIHIRAGTDAEATCLLRELSVYDPKLSRRTILIELERDHSERLLLGLLAAVQTCLEANDIRSVRVELDGRPYLLAPQSTS